jgi:hypothetical protein
VWKPLRTFTLEVKMRFQIVQGDEQLSSHSGLALIGAVEESAGVVGRLAPMITPCHGSLVAVDIDVSPFDNSKTKLEIARECGEMEELRPGKQVWWGA